MLSKKYIFENAGRFCLCCGLLCILKVTFCRVLIKLFVKLHLELTTEDNLFLTVSSWNKGNVSYRSPHVRLTLPSMRKKMDAVFESNAMTVKR